MILVGQYDSSFVRRVGLALTFYGLDFEHRPWSIFSDAAKVQDLNPLIRVPTLVLENGDVLIDSHVILDYVDGLMPPRDRLLPQTEPDRHRALKVVALATGLADKGVSLFYERVLHEHVSPVWVDRCRSQISATLGVLENDRAGRRDAYWFGARIGHADIAVAACLRHTHEAHPDLIAWPEYPALKAHCDRLEALPAFRRISQPFIPPA